MKFRKTKTIITGVMLLGIAALGMPVSTLAAEFPQTYVAFPSENNNESIKEYIKTPDLSELVGKKTAEQIPYRILEQKKIAVVKGVRLNLRKGCSTKEEVLAVMEAGEEVVMLGYGKNPHWAYIETESHGRGFVFADYLKIKGIANTQKVCLVELDSEKEKDSLTAKGIQLQAVAGNEDQLLVEFLKGKNLEQICYKKTDPKKKYVNAGNNRLLRMRSGCSSAYEEIAAYPCGTEVTVDGYGINQSWAHVTVNGQEGFLFVKYLSDKKPEETPAYQTWVTQWEVTPDETTSEPSDEEEVKETTVLSLGTFRLTFYCNCSSCCGKWAGGRTASGTIPVQGRTIAVDPDVIPLGSRVLIDGQEYIAEDTGGAIKGNRIDVYMDSHKEALRAGVKNAEVYLLTDCQP